jgi:hypothetical protein
MVTRFAAKPTLTAAPGRNLWDAYASTDVTAVPSNDNRTIYSYFDALGRVYSVQDGSAYMYDASRGTSGGQAASRAHVTTRSAR